MSPATLSNGGNVEDEKDIEARFETSIEALLHEQLHPSWAALDRERDLDIYRSGSAPPTVEGSRSAVGRLFGHAGAPEARCRDTMTAEEMRSHPEYLSYKYSKNLNPRLPHPMSQEHWGAAQRYSAGLPSFGGIGDRRRREEPGEGGRSWSSLFSVQPGLPGYNGNGDSAEQISGTLQSPPQHPSAAWLEPGNDGLIGLPGGVKLGARSKSFADALREDFGRSASSSGHLSSPISHNAFNNIVDPLRLSDVQVTHLPNHMGTVDGMHSGATPNGLARVQSLGSTMSHSFASSLNSRSTTPEPQLIVRSSSPCLPPVVGRGCDMDRKIVSNGFGSVPSSMTDFGDTTIALSGLKLTDKVIEDEHNHVQGQSRQVFTDHHKLQFNMPADERQYIQHNIVHKAETESSVPSIPLQVYSDLSKRISVHKSLATGSPAMSSSPLDAGVTEGEYFNRSANQVGSGRHVPNVDYLYAQYRQRADSGRQSPASLRDPSLGRNYLDTSLIDFQYQDEYLEAFLAQQKLQYDASFSGKSAGFNSGLYDNSAFGLGTPYPSPLSGSVISSLGPGSFLRQNDRLPHFSPILRCAAGGSKGSLNHENGIMQGGFVSSLLEELKNSRARSFELSEIVGHVVEFSADQYGSRFIQQKLETASAKEKNYIFPEVLPHALVLMTDVFGNYVIQKFFEHGTESQRNQLADKLMGYVLPLSLQMYGCRVIQKALEVLDVDQQTWMVSELDGSIMKCVRDQNGNHVIQKCIECVPQERIQFIISSFYGQVVALSTHPYGCRVIQRVLEHCNDAKTQGIMIDEIMHSVSALAQDQYGNYVVQHVLQHGKQEERSAIVRKLAGQMVKMSQQKFASNVVEKCLTYGTPEERQLLINEILGSTDENEPLQAMMKDQFGNYVVQKVLEICNDQNRELILSRIKVHVNALKKYTYGKHIVARVEKLIATGERCIAMSPYST